MTDPELVAKRLAIIETSVRSLRELARPTAIHTDVLGEFLQFADTMRKRLGG